MYEVKRFHCDYCRKVLSNKSYMERHEKFCPRNPDSRSCGTCEHLVMVDHFVDHPEADHPVNIPIPTCELNKFSTDNRTERNPHGMRSNCPFHVLDPYRFE